jgi:hypothetical protein
LCEIRLHADGALERLDGLGVSLVLAQRDAQLEVALRQLRVERDRAAEQRFYPLQRVRRERRILDLPQAHGVVEMCERVARLRFERYASGSCARRRTPHDLETGWAR